MGNARAKGQQAEGDRIAANLVELAAGSRREAETAWLAVRSLQDETAARLAVWRACAIGSTEEDRRAAGDLLQRLEQSEVEHTKRLATSRWHAWIARSIRGGAGAAHRWSNAVNTKSAEITSPHGNLPMTVAAHHTEHWAGIWGAHSQEVIDDTTRIIAELRTRALQHRRHAELVSSITAQSVKAVARSFRAGTAIGSDCQSFLDIAGASEEAREDLAGILRASVTSLAWPKQALLTLIGLLGKKAGGTRAIAVIATFARLLLAHLKGEVRAWDSRIGDVNDTALAGRRPMDETARRHMKAEVATLLDKHVVTVFVVGHGEVLRLVGRSNPSEGSRGQRLPPRPARPGPRPPSRSPRDQGVWVLR
jgi:plasmid stability protein